MTRPVDPDLVARFVLRETTDAEAAEVSRLVKEDPAWAAELKLQAQLDLHVFAGFDALRDRTPAPAPRGWFAWLPDWRIVVPALTFAAGALLWLQVQPTVDYALELHGGESAIRADAAPTGMYTHGSSLDLVLRASEPTQARPEVTVAIDGAPVSGARVERIDGGTIRVSGTFGAELPALQPGPHTLTVTVDGAEHHAQIVWDAPRGVAP